MPLYYFDLYDSGGLYRDDIGDEFATVEEALVQIRTILPDVARSSPPRGDRDIVVCELRDEAGRILYRAELTYRGIRLSV